MKTFERQVPSTLVLSATGSEGAVSGGEAVAGRRRRHSSFYPIKLLFHAIFGKTIQFVFSDCVERKRRSLWNLKSISRQWHRDKSSKKWINADRLHVLAGHFDGSMEISASLEQPTYNTRVQCGTEQDTLRIKDRQL